MSRETRIQETIKNYEQALQKAITRDKNFSGTPQEAVERLAEMDPSRQSKYLRWLTQRYCDTQFRLEDAPRIKRVLQSYIELKPRLARYGHDPDLNRYSLHDLEAVVDSIYQPKLGEDYEDVVGFPEAKNFGTDIEILHDSPLGTLAVPKTMEASIYLGRGTKWCTAASDPDDNMFDRYVSHFSDLDQLYVYKNSKGEKFQFHFETMQFMNSQDEELSEEELRYFRYRNPVTRLLFAEREIDLLEASRDGEDLIDYAKKVIQGRWKKAEETLLHPHMAQALENYIFWVYCNETNDRWPAAELAMLSILDDRSNKKVVDPRSHVDHFITGTAETLKEYAHGRIKGRWLELENYLCGAETMESAVVFTRLYFNHIEPFLADKMAAGNAVDLKERILENPKAAAAFASTVLDSRWPEAEDIIKRDPDAASHYAIHVLKARWNDKQAEDIIATDKWAAHRYMEKLVRSPWPAAEPVLAQNKDVALYYAKHGLGGKPFPLGEEAILQGSWELTLDYVRSCTRNRWPAFEKKITDALVGADHIERRNLRRMAETYISVLTLSGINVQWNDGFLPKSKSLAALEEIGSANVVLGSGNRSTGLYKI